MAIAVHLRNDGPPIDRRAAADRRVAGPDPVRRSRSTCRPARTRPTSCTRSRRRSGSDLEVVLVERRHDHRRRPKVAFTVHDAEPAGRRRRRRAAGRHRRQTVQLLPNQNQVAPVIVPLDLADLPERVEAWAALDRLIWQDVDSSRLTDGPDAALRGWVAGGGRLVIVGGHGRARHPVGLPRRAPALSTERHRRRRRRRPRRPARHRPGECPGSPRARRRADRGPRAAHERRPRHRRRANATATARSRSSASTRPPSGWPTAPGPRTCGDGSCRHAPRPGWSLADDSQLVGAVSQLPALALPPIGGLIVLLFGYIAARRPDQLPRAPAPRPPRVGVGDDARAHRRLRRRRVRLRRGPARQRRHRQRGRHRPRRAGHDRRGRAGLPRRLLADAWDVPGRASPAGRSSRRRSTATSSAATARPRRSTSSRATRRRSATSPSASDRCGRSVPRPPVSVPLVKADLSLVDGRLKGTITNESEVTLEKPAVVLGGTVAVLTDLAPGATQSIDTPLRPGPVRPAAVGQGRRADLLQRPEPVRQPGVEDVHPPRDRRPADLRPEFRSTGQLATDGAVILAWGSGSLLPVEIEGQTPRSTGNILYYLPADVTVTGKTTFRGDLITLDDRRHRRAVLQQGPDEHQLRARHRPTVSYRPIAVRRHADADRARVRSRLRWRPDGIDGDRRADRAPRRDPGALPGPADGRLRRGRVRRPARGRGVRPRRRATGSASRT